MRVYISADLEGVNGVVHSSQTQPGEPGYERAVERMHDELNAVVKGARAAGAAEVLIADAHWDARNLRVEKLPHGVKLVSGWQRPFSMMSGVTGKVADKEVAAGQFECAFFVGYHARAGMACGVLSHTYRAQTFLDVQLNGRPVGEIGLNAALAGYFGIPVAFVSGDDSACREAVELLGEVKTVAVKQALSRYSAVCLPSAETLVSLEKTAEDAVRAKNWQIFKPAEVSTLTLTFFDPAMADAAELLPQVKRLGDRTVNLSADDYSQLFRLFLACGVLGASRKDPYF